MAEVERLDIAAREIHLQPNNSRTRVVGYSDAARVLSRGREYPVTQLEVGDIVAMQLKQDSRGNSYTDLVRVQESVRDRDQSRGASPRPTSGNQTVDGRVEQVDSSAIPSKCVINRENECSFPSPTTRAGRMSIVSTRFAPAITSESRAVFSIAIASSWTVF